MNSVSRAVTLGEHKYRNDDTSYVGTWLWAPKAMKNSCILYMIIGDLNGRLSNGVVAAVER